MSKKESKKDTKSINQQKLQLQKQQEQQLLRLQKEKQQKQRHQRFLAQQSSPLIDFGLLDGYQYFLTHLAQAGIPQANVFQFAAQMILKYEKNKIKKQRQIKSLHKFNQQAIKQDQISPTKGNKSQRGNLSSKKTFNKKPNLLPFKGQLTQKQLSILGGGGKVKIGDNTQIIAQNQSKKGQQSRVQSNQFDKQNQYK